MADDALSGCWAKLTRVLELISAIEQAERDYLNTDPPPVWVKGAHEGSDFVFRAFGPENAPERFSVLAGEIIHHLRTCLDHVVWALATKYSGLPSGRIQFPICDKRAGFDEALKKGILRGIRAEAIKIIESVQPFTSNGSPRETILYVLHHLDIQDKHKLLLVTATAAELAK